jgi:hypothetical protein
MQDVWKERPRRRQVDSDEEEEVPTSDSTTVSLQAIENVTPGWMEKVQQVWEDKVASALAIEEDVEEDVPEAGKAHEMTMETEDLTVDYRETTLVHYEPLIDSNDKKSLVDRSVDLLEITGKHLKVDASFLSDTLSAIDPQESTDNSVEYPPAGTTTLEAPLCLSTDKTSPAPGTFQVCVSATASVAWIL